MADQPSTSKAPAEVITVTYAFTDGGKTSFRTTSAVVGTVVRTNAQCQVATTTEHDPAVFATNTDSLGRTVVTQVANLAPTAGEVLTTTNEEGLTFITTYTSAGISSIKLITTTGADGKPSTIISYAYVDPAGSTEKASTTEASTTSLLRETSTPVSASAASNPGLTTGAKAGTGVGAAIGILFIAIVAYVRSANGAAPVVGGSNAERIEHKAELDGQGREAAETDGRGVTRWWSTRFRRSTTVRALNASEPQELPADEVHPPGIVRQAQARPEGPSEFQAA